MIRVLTTKLFFRCALLLLLIAGGPMASLAQTAEPCPSPSPATSPEPEFIVPARPTVSNPAEFQRPGVLQLEVGFNRNLHASEDSSPWDFPLALRFAVSRRLLVEFDGDSPFAQESGGMRVTGAGDSQLGVQLVLQHEHEKNPARPGISFAYYIKVPTANSRRGLGTGRVDHSFIGLLSRKHGDFTFDVNGTWLLAGRTSNLGHASSAQGAAAISYQIAKRWALQGELSGFGRNDQQSGAMSTLAAVAYQVKCRLVIDGGVRAGLTHDAPAWVAFVGMTVGVADLYRHHHRAPN